jgi:predicted alpha/beta superfamily hydrolase
MRYRLTAFLLLVTCAGTNVAAQPEAWRSEGAFTMPRTEVFALRDTARPGDSYRIAVSVPAGYETGEQRFPVVYVLDGDWYFGLAASTARLLEAVGELPPLITVSIGYGGTVAEQRARRVRELTPDPVAGLAGSGEAAAFLRVLRNDLLPLIERRYRTTGDRTLVGHSLGGLFATFAVLRTPDLFGRVIIGSPALRTSGPALVKGLAALHATGPLPQRIFLGLAAGDFPPVREDYQSLHAWLKTAPPSVRWTAEEFAGMTHQSVVPSLFARALPWVFSEK